MGTLLGAFVLAEDAPRFPVGSFEVAVDVNDVKLFRCGSLEGLLCATAELVGETLEEV